MLSGVSFNILKKSKSELIEIFGCFLRQPEFNIFQYSLLFFDLNSFIFCLITFLWLTILLSSSFLYSFSAFFISNFEDSVLFLLCLLFNLQFNHGFLDTHTLLFSYVSRSLNSKSCLSWIYKKFAELACEEFSRLNLFTEFSKSFISSKSRFSRKKIFFEFSHLRGFSSTFLSAIMFDNDVEYKLYLPQYVVCFFLFVSVLYVSNWLYAYMWYVVCLCYFM